MLENSAQSRLAGRRSCEEILGLLPGVALAFNPAHFAHMGENPFLYTFYKGKLKHRIAQLYITDGCRRGDETYTLPGRGQAEVRELISLLRCRSFSGIFCLHTGAATGKAAFIQHAQAFWRLMDNL